MLSAIAAQASYVVLPKDTHAKQTVLEFLVQKFPHISPDIWLERAKNGKLHWQDGRLIDETSSYQAGAKVFYYREVPEETKIPFAEKILFQDAHLLIVYKPHFLPVTPSGNYVNECLVHRLRIKTGIADICPAHRLDRETAGVMLFSVNPKTRHLYHELFKLKQIAKSYHALAELSPSVIKQISQQGLPLIWQVKNRLAKANPSFTMQIIDGEPNSHSVIKLIAVKQNIGLFELSPITGKTHQLRVHMQSLGMPLVNDRFYPILQPKAVDNYNQPLQLLAYQLRFIDPVTQKAHQWQIEGLRL